MKTGDAGGKSKTGGLGHPGGPKKPAEPAPHHLHPQAKKPKAAVKKKPKPPDDAKGGRFRSLDTRDGGTQGPLDISEPLQSGRPGFTNSVRR